MIITTQTITRRHDEVKIIARRTKAGYWVTVTVTPNNKKLEAQWGQSFHRDWTSARAAFDAEVRLHTLPA